MSWFSLDCYSVLPLPTQRIIYSVSNAICHTIYRVLLILWLNLVCLPDIQVYDNYMLIIIMIIFLYMLQILSACIFLYIYFTIESTFSGPRLPVNKVVSYNEAVDNSKWFFLPVPCKYTSSLFARMKQLSKA